MTSYIMSNGEEYLEEEDEERDITLIKARSEASSPWGHDRMDGSSEGSVEDSDAEFAVHPILRSLIKSKSAYTIPKETSQMKTSKTTFELSLSRVLSSASAAVSLHQEPPVPSFSSPLSESWPEPESPKSSKKKKPPLSRLSGCWSSPPNVFLEDLASTDSPFPEVRRDGCWSAPEYDQSSEDDDERESISSDLSASPFSHSYPAILSISNQPPLIPSSVCSLRIGSSPSSSAPSPSPPRPLSPVLGRPGVPSSFSMVLPARPSLSHLTSSQSPSSEEAEEWSKPWPHQEVWPEEAVMNRSVRHGWTDASTHQMAIPRSNSMQIRHPLPSRFPNSRSAYGSLFTRGAGLPIESEHSSHAHSPERNDDMSEMREYAGAVEGSAHFGDPTHFGDSAQQHEMDGSAHSVTSNLDESESIELNRRTAWLERGSIVQLSKEFGAESSWPRPLLKGDGGGMKRSLTTAEFRKGRRKLPIRPDEMAFRGELSSSVSMYEQPFYEYREEEVGYSDYGSRPGCSSSMQNCDHTTDSNLEERIPAPASLPLHNRSPDPYSHLQTPISPMFVLPSPQSSSGRKLPPLPISSNLVSNFARIPAMAIPVKNDHTLCFIEGMSDSILVRSQFEDSYYEEDGINGNGLENKKTKMFFSAADSSGVSSCTNSESISPTHRAQFPFIPRHSDEVLLEIGDAIHVERTSEDHWCLGTNLRTGLTGIFPVSVVCEIDLVDEICTESVPALQMKVPSTAERDTFYLTMLASIEVAHHKGNDTLIQAMNKVLSMYKDREEVIVPQTVLMEISFRGIHVIDKRKKNFFQCPTFDFFYSLQNISFCGAHPKQLKYFGFITKHPILPRFACHVFMSNSSTQPIVEAIGRAFKRSYDEYMAFAHPTEDIYLE